MTRKWVLAVVMTAALAWDGPAWASCCSTVYDPTNHATNLETLTKDSMILDQAIQQVGELLSLNSAFGSSGSLDLRSFGGISDLLDLSTSLSSLTASSSFSLSNVIGQSTYLQAAAPSFSAMTLPSGTSTSSLTSLEGSKSFVLSVLRGGSRITDVTEGEQLEARRASEYRSAVDEAHAAALYHLEAVARTKDRITELTAMAETVKETGDYRQQSAVQLAAINAALIALIEETAAIRNLQAAQLRVTTATVYAATRGVGQNFGSTTSTVPSSWK